MITKPIRVAIVDDDALVRAGLILMLDGVEGITIVADAADGDQVMRLVDTYSPHVILMDIRMPKVDGIVATAMCVVGRIHPKCWCSLPSTPMIMWYAP